MLDASRAVGVTSALLSDERRAAYASDVRAEYQRIREERAARGGTERLVPLAVARANAARVDWSRPVPVPSFTGVRAFAPYPLATLVDFIDWTPFFQTWELAGHFPAILDDPVVGAAATSLYHDARALLDRIVRENLFEARAAVGFWPVRSRGDDIVVHAPDDRDTSLAPIATLHMLRQQMDRRGSDRPNLCLADFVAPGDGDVVDYLGAFTVTTGHGVEQLAQEFRDAHDDYNAILAQALGDRLAEAFAEHLHARVRREWWGYAPDETIDHEALIRERYQGIRPAPGYPACPDHTEKGTLFALLDAAAHTGASLTESFAMHPASSVAGWYFWRPEAEYFGVGKIDDDQVSAYADRKGWTVDETRRRLAPQLRTVAPAAVTA